MQNRTIIGVDLGGTKIDVARYDAATWERQAAERYPTHADRTFGHVLDDLVAAIEQIRTADTVAIGIGVPGLVRQSDGTIVTLPNIPGAEGAPLKQQLEQRTDLPVTLENDANCFTLAEALRGAGKGQDVVVGITLGTGVGGGIVINGTLFRGAHGYGGEIGHMLLQPGQPPFATEDKRGDVEQFLSGNAMGKRCEQAKNPGEYLSGDTCSFMHPDLFRELAWLCTNLVHALDPSAIVLGGSAGRALKPHLKDIQRELHQWVLPGTPLPALVTAELEDSATLGAALLAAHS
jgi:glucokinase